jgi:hypothetical protein
LQRPRQYGHHGQARIERERHVRHHIARSGRRANGRLVGRTADGRGRLETRLQTCPTRGHRHRR